LDGVHVDAEAGAVVDGDGAVAGVRPWFADPRVGGGDAGELADAGASTSGKPPRPGCRTPQAGRLAVRGRRLRYDGGGATGRGADQQHATEDGGRRTAEV
jgi:hypothetical protein